MVIAYNMLIGKSKRLPWYIIDTHEKVPYSILQQRPHLKLQMSLELETNPSLECRHTLVSTAASVLTLTTDVDNFVYQHPLNRCEIVLEQLHQSMKFIIVLDALNENQIDENEEASHWTKLFNIRLST